MQVTSLNNTTSFKAIKLSRTEANKVGSLVRAYRNIENIEAKSQIVDIFIPHIEKEARRKAEENVNLSIKDYAQNLHLKLLEKIETVSLQFHPVPDILSTLNEYKIQNDDCIVLENNKSLEVLSPEEEYIISDKGQATLKEKMHAIVLHFIKNKRSKEMLDDYIDGYTKEELAQKYSLTKSRIMQIIEKNAKILYHTENVGRYFVTIEKIDGKFEPKWSFKQYRTGRIGSFLEDTN